MGVGVTSRARVVSIAARERMNRRAWHLALAEKYRARAEDLRRIAATLEDAESREKMLTLADEYANMARCRGAQEHPQILRHQLAAQAGP